jgi:hypothetical protein
MQAAKRTDLDFLSRLMKAKQHNVYCRRVEDEAKAARKASDIELTKVMDELEPYVAGRLDEINMPKFPDMDFGQKPPEDGKG